MHRATPAGDSNNFNAFTTNQVSYDELCLSSVSRKVNRARAFAQGKKWLIYWCFLFGRNDLTDRERDLQETNVNKYKCSEPMRRPTPLRGYLSICNYTRTCFTSHYFSAIAQCNSCSTNYYGCGSGQRPSSPLLLSGNSELALRVNCLNKCQSHSIDSREGLMQV